MAQLVVLTTRVYIDHDRLLPPQEITQVLQNRLAGGDTAASRGSAARQCCRYRLQGLSQMEMYNPCTPGQFIKWWYLGPNKVTPRQFAEQLGVSISTFNRLLNGQTRITLAMAERLFKVAGRSPGSWIQLQEMRDRSQVRLRNAA